MNLQSKVQVLQIVVFAELGLLVRRPELQRLCQRAWSEPGQILTKTLCQQALPGLSEAGSKNMIRAVAAMGLCDSEGRITEDGKETMDSGLAPIPEQGVYRLWLAEHPLFGKRVLHFERLRVDPKDNEYTEEDLPFRIPLRQVFASIVDNTPFKLLEHPKACRWEMDHAGCSLHLAIDFDNHSSGFSFTGELTPTLPITKQPEEVDLDYEQLLTLWTNNAWDKEARRLRVDLSKLSGDAQESFVMDYPLGRVDVPGKGRYQNAILQKTPLAPRDRGEAQTWAELRFERRRKGHKGYLSRGAQEKFFSAGVVATPLEEFSPTLPPLDNLLGERERAGDHWGYFQLVAAEDLCL